MWQELREELHPRGLEIVTIALDAAGADAAGPWIAKAAPRHPSLIDREHVVDALFGIV
ncbi:MAG: TlpA family protein disulfide reductase, partial [Chloroflexi bacterium]